MTEDAFQDKVQEEVSNIYQQKRSGRPAWKFFSHVDDKNDLNADAKEDTERTALYRQGETAKDEDIANGFFTFQLRYSSPSLTLGLTEQRIGRFKPMRCPEQPMLQEIHLRIVSSFP